MLNSLRLRQIPFFLMGMLLIFNYNFSGCDNAEIPLQEDKSQSIGKETDENPKQTILNGDPVVSSANIQFVRVESLTPASPVRCSGTLIRNNWVLTAKHCIEGTTSTSVKREEGSYSVAAVLLHPTSDIALLKLSANIPTGRVGYASVFNSGYKTQLYSSSTKPLIGRTLTCFGYGDNKTDGTGYGVLRYADLRVKDVDDQAIVYEKNARGQNLAPGDSGSSCIENGNIVSVTFFRIADTTFGVNIASVRDWILEQIGEVPSALGVVGDGSSWQKVYRTNNENLAEEKLWSFGWAAWSKVRGGGSSEGAHPAPLWNNTLSKIELFSLDRFSPSLYSLELPAGMWNLIPTGSFVPLSAPSAIQIGDYIYLFWLTDSKKIAIAARDRRGSWSPPSLVGSPAEEFSSAPAVVTDQGNIYLFARGKSGDLKFIPYLWPAGWGSWTSLGGYITSAPGVTMNASGKIYVAARGKDLYGLWYKTLDAKTLASSPWKEIPGITHLASGPGAIVNGGLTGFYVLDENGLIAETHEQNFDKEDWWGWGRGF